MFIGFTIYELEENYSNWKALNSHVICYMQHIWDLLNIYTKFNYQNKLNFNIIESCYSYSLWSWIKRIIFIDKIKTIKFLNQLKKIKNCL